MTKLSISAKLKTNKNLFLLDMKKRNVQSRLTALISIFASEKKIKDSDNRFVCKNFDIELKSLAASKGKMLKSVEVYHKLKKAASKSK